MNKIISRLFSLAIILFIISGCTEQGVQRTNFISDQDLETGNIKVEYNQALVMYASGTVEVSVEDGWQAVEVGDFVLESQAMRIGEGSFCELQFGERAVVRIEENTKIQLQTLFLKPDESDIKLNVEVGTVLCKVNKLSEGEQFKVKTKTAVCGVRGTEFGVTVDQSQETALAVREGKVAILPSSVDVDSLIEQAAESDESIIDIINELEASAPIVSADEEVVVTEATMNETEAVFVAVEKEVRKIADKENSAVTKQDRDSLKKSINTTNARIQTKVAKPKLVSVERREKLDKIEKIKFHEIPVVPDRKLQDDAAVPVKKAPQLIRIGIKVLPKDATIFMENQFLGRGRFQGLYTPGQQLKVRVEKEGFVSQTLFIDVNTSGKKFFDVKLEEEVQKTVKADPEVPDTVEKPVVKDVPKDKDTAVKPDRSEKPVRPDREVSSGIEKDKPTKSSAPEVNIIKPANVPFINEIIPGPGGIFGADRNGTVYAVSFSGKVLWSVKTTNNPNNNSSPVVMGNRVYFSGQRELVVLDAGSGNIIARYPLTGAANHMFGRRVVDAGQFVLLPTDNSIRLLNKADGSVAKEFNIPGSSRMTPTVMNNIIYFVNSLGSVQGIDLATGNVTGNPIVTKATEPIGISISVQGTRGYFAGRRNTLVCVDLKQTRVVWEVQMQANDFPHQNLLVTREGVYVLAGNSLFGFSHAGARLFNQINGVTAAPGYFAGKLYIPRDNMNLLIVNAANGNKIDSLQMQSKISARPIITKDQIIAGTDSGQLLFIKNQ